MTTSRHLPPISLAAFDVLWQTWCLDTGRSDLRKPLVLDGPSPGSTPSARRRVEQLAYQELNVATSHLGTGGMRQLYPVLEALAEPDMEISLRWDAAGPGRAMAVQRGHLPVLAWMAYPATGDRRADTPATVMIQFSWGITVEPAGDLVSLLPARPAGNVRGHSQSVEAALLRQARASINDSAQSGRQQPWSTMWRALRAAGVGEDASRAFANLVDQKCVGRGELRVGVRGQFGRRRPSSWIRVNDTDKGRYLLTIDHRGWITVRGADTGVLANVLRMECDNLTSHR